MYDCGQQLEIKIETLRRLGFGGELLKLYLPGPAPAQPSDNQRALLELNKIIIIWAQTDEYDMADFFTITSTCPYCRRALYTKLNADCSRCEYQQAFGDYNSLRYANILDLIFDYELDPSIEQFKSALEYLQEQIKCGR